MTLSRKKVRTYTQTPTISSHLRRCGVPRRDFLKLCTQLMVAAPWGLAITEKATAAGVRDVGRHSALP
jgi:hypothetical protein